MMWLWWSVGSCCRRRLLLLPVLTPLLATPPLPPASHPLVTLTQVYARFEGHLLLRPGVYRVKLLVDGEWRLASDWPTEKDKAGNTVNLLTVT